MSIGGWTLSRLFSDAVAGDSQRQGFVAGILALLDRFPGVFNRIDIDWEHISPVGENYGAPGNVVRAEDGANFVKFLAQLRARARRHGTRWL